MNIKKINLDKKKIYYFNIYQNSLISLIKLIISEVKIGVVITTHGFNGVFIQQTLNCFLRELPDKAFIVLFINESNDSITLNLKNKYKNVKIIYINDQIKSGGLTNTWNKGIKLCLDNNCDIVVLSNDDILFDNNVCNILNECYENRKI